MKKPETIFREKCERDLKRLEPDVAAETIQQKSKRGTADKLICAAGAFIWLEFKREEGQEEALQTYKRKKFEKAGAIVFVVRPSNWPEVFREIQDIVSYNKRRSW